MKEKIIFDTKEKITDFWVVNSNVKLLSEWTLFMSFKLSIWKLAFAWKNLYTNEAIAWLPIKNPNELNKNFLYYVLLWYEFWKTWSDNSVKWATLNKEKLKQIPIPLPPLPTQQKIVVKLDSLFEKLVQAITLTKQNLANIEELNKSVLEKIFKKCEEKYENRKLEEVCEIWPKKSELNNLDWKLEVAFVPMKYLNEKEKFFKYGEVKTLDEVRWWYTYFTENDVLLAKVTPCFENWKSWIAKNLLNNIWFGSSEFYVFRANEKILPEWIYYIITSENFLKNWKNNMSGAVWLKRVTKNFIENFQIPLPPLPEQQKIVEYLDNIFAKNKILQEKYKQDLKNFEELKQSILKQAFENEDFIK